jgi:hypothetical protein
MVVTISDNVSRVRGSVTNNNRFWIRWLDLLKPSFTTTYNSSQSMTPWDSLHSVLDYECLLFCCDWLGSDLRIGHFLSFRCPLGNTPQLNTQRNSTTELPSEFSSDWITTDSNDHCILTHSRLNQSIAWPPFITLDEPNRDHHFQQFTLLHVYPLPRKHMLLL